MFLLVIGLSASLTLIGWAGDCKSLLGWGRRGKGGDFGFGLFLPMIGGQASLALIGLSGCCLGLLGGGRGLLHSKICGGGHLV